MDDLQKIVIAFFTCFGLSIAAVCMVMALLASLQCVWNILISRKYRVINQARNDTYSEVADEIRRCAIVFIEDKPAMELMCDISRQLRLHKALFPRDLLCDYRENRLCQDASQESCDDDAPLFEIGRPSEDEDVD